MGIAILIIILLPIVLFISWFSNDKPNGDSGIGGGKIVLYSCGIHKTYCIISGGNVTIRSQSVNKIIPISKIVSVNLSKPYINNRWALDIKTGAPITAAFGNSFYNDRTKMTGKFKDAKFKGKARGNTYGYSIETGITDDDANRITVRGEDLWIARKIQEYVADYSTNPNTRVDEHARSGGQARPAFCKDCGIRLDEESKFCPSCGTPQVRV